ncbi:nitroreductase family protein [Portibacter lacus]|uniref:Nitroreductase domain-containing protein n=1 Tax=Portibacter lacus TaxID=1099794 RepID=A0AA37SRX2_9BACT|nr:nitroreductase family protein [Portibacter lacus]GLR16940.1 hypothetical protein GCM10007940_15550 [Portibacter lacus]
MSKTANSKYELSKDIANRWSPRVFSDKEITLTQIETLFEAARWAPSSNNGQPWRFMYTLKGTEAYDKAFSCLAEFNQSWVANAPILVLTAYKKTFDNGKENFHALHDLGLAVSNLSLQAQSMGIAVHQMAGVNWRKAHEVYNIPEDFHVTTAIAIGYYGGDVQKLPEELQKAEVAERQRISLSKIVNEGTFNL